ncbi:MAG TPA: hypothetical protein DEQ80_04655 [Anaerolinea thermolimosa]|uniref:Uncharacterized protein n=1 Tax=Anaerolinea thermolimosa TaxID=229919 RepID=A0A3D1JEY1_9CHLR|nr:hypothetical protein [Anaerolinea thermolimosa]
MNRNFDLGVVLRVIIAPALLWLGVSWLVSSLGYPDIIFATPAAWLLALPVGRSVVIRSRSERLWFRLLEAGTAGTLLGFFQGATFLLIKALVLKPGLPESEIASTMGGVVLILGMLICGTLATAIGARTDRLRRIRRAGDVRLEVTSQYCPICKNPVPVSARYPRAVCEDCAAQATDEAGKPVVFFQEGLSSGLQGKYRENDEAYPAQECYIRGVRCRVEEGHLGGVVIYPLD